MNEPEQFLTVSALAKRYPGFTESSLRWQLFNRKRTGFDRCVVRVGRRVLIDEAEFVAWLRSHREGIPGNAATAARRAA